MTTAVRKLRDLIALARPIRNGLEPSSALRLMVRGGQTVRFRGAEVRGSDRGLLIHLALSVWGGEYDAPGFQAAAGERVVDVGANVGFFAILAASRGAQVDAYEPFPVSFDLLYANALPWAIRCHQAAVVSAGSSANGKVKLWLHPTHPSRHTVLTDDVTGGQPLSESVEVDAVSLAEAIGEGCDLLKLDCEGAEFSLLLETPPESMRRARCVVAELHEHAGDGEAVRAHLDSLGFQTRLERKSDDHGLALLFAARSSAPEPV